jgi:hypothetical protein
MQKSRALLAVLSLIGAIGVTYACISGNVGDDQSLKLGDAGLLAPFRFNYRGEFDMVFGKLPESGEKYDEVAASKEVVLRDVLRQLKLELERRGDAKAGDKLKTMEDAMKVLLKGGDSHEWDSGLKNTLKELPAEFRLYATSLIGGREWQLQKMNELLALPQEERSHLTGLAHYRKARLLTLMSNWDKREYDWEKADYNATKQRLREIREHLESALLAFKNGAPDIGQISRTATCWLANSYSEIMPFHKLKDLQEADPARSLKIYLAMWKGGDHMGYDCAYSLIRTLAMERVGHFACAQDPDLRRLMTLYLCSGGDRSAGHEPDGAEGGDIAAWLENLRWLKVDFSDDAARVASLQYFAGNYADCEKTLTLCAEDDLTAAMLRSRMELRLGRRLEAAEALRPAVAKLPDEAHPTNWGAYPYSWEDRSPKWFSFDRENPSSLQGKARAELALLELAAGRHLEALRLSLRAGLDWDATYIAECVLTVDELKSFVDAECKGKMVRDRWAYGVYTANDETVDMNVLMRDLLVRRLCRANRWEEALPYANEKIAPFMREHMRLMSVAADEKAAARTRADAYWRSAVILWSTDWDEKSMLYCNFGPSWSSTVGWYDDEWPNCRVRPNQNHPWQPLSSPGEDERKRVEAWLGANYNPPNKGHRVTKYEMLRLTLKAAELLPDNDPAGAKILQFAGSQMMYLDPPVANAAYKLLATRFKETEYGKYAFENRWFMKPEAMKVEDGGGDEPKPNPEWVAK